MKYLLVLFFLVVGCSHKPHLLPPVAEKVPHSLTQNDDTRVDDYYWMRDRENPKVIQYLEQENAYFEDHFAPMMNLKEKLFTELKGRIQKDDSSVPVFENGYFYYTKYNASSEHPIVARKKQTLGAKEEIILDANELAQGKSYFQLGNWEVDASSNILAFATDTVGRRKFDIAFKDLTTGKLLPYKIESVTPNFVFAEDDAHFFYTRQNPQTLRNEWVHRLNYKTGEDKIVYHEKDEKFYAGVGKSRSKKYLFIGGRSSESSEFWLLNAVNPTEALKLFARRRPKVEYDVNHAGSYFVIRSNHNAENFKISRTPDLNKTAVKYWKTLIPHRKHVLVSDIDVFSSYFVLSIRKDGVRELEILERKTGRREVLEHPEKSHVVYMGSNPNFKLKDLRYSYQSMTTPASVIDFNMTKKTKEVKKVHPVLGGFKKENYQSERIFVTTNDGTQIPVSIVYRKGFQKDGRRPFLLTGYGSYGFSMEPWFSDERLSLLDRGFGVAIAHIRGGSEMGRSWYLDGKFLKKKNTFTDFIAVGDFLVAHKYADPKRLYASGGSAGGLLVGAAINMRPDLFQGIVAQVPFVDVLTTMLDESIPLTTNEFEEWGNPKQPNYYHYIKSYSPYDNIERKNYPPMLVTSGLHDSQVQYWEPTKWVAKLRDYKTDSNVLLLHTNMEAGHGGKSGRFQRLEDTAQEYAFLLHLAGIKE